jgi:hypothetical protein
MVDRVERDELIKKMQARVAKCRFLARSIDDEMAKKSLNAMADEGEADIARLLAENSE